MATETLVDAHVHVASADEHRYPRQPTGAGSTWWRTPNGGEELRGAMDAVGVDRAVVVQAVGVYGYDCRYAAHVAEAGGDRLAFVGAVDMAGADIGAAIDRLDAETGLDGLRLFGVGGAGAGWLADGTGHLVWTIAAERGWVLVPTIFSDGLPALRALMEAEPSVVVALDHCGFPDLGGPGAMDDLLAMADLGSLHLKVTSHNLDTDEDPATFLQAVVGAFGAARVCWGSDHPQHQVTTYPEMLALARRATRGLTDHERAGFLGDNALRLWWSPTAAALPTTPEGPRAR